MYSTINQKQDAAPPTTSPGRYVCTWLFKEAVEATGTTDAAALLEKGLGIREVAGQVGT